MTLLELINLRDAITRRMKHISPDDGDDVHAMVGFAADLGLDVRAILATADEPQGKRRHSEDAGRPWTPAICTCPPWRQCSMNCHGAHNPNAGLDGLGRRPTQPTGMAYTPVVCTDHPEQEGEGHE